MTLNQTNQQSEKQALDSAAYQRLAHLEAVNKLSEALRCVPITPRGSRLKSSNVSKHWSVHILTPPWSRHF